MIGKKTWAKTLARQMKGFFYRLFVFNTFRLFIFISLAIPKQALIISEPNEGTTVKVYLPQHAGETIEAHNKGILELPLSRGETVLLVEDDGGILYCLLTVQEKLSDWQRNTLAKFTLL